MTLETYKYTEFIPVVAERFFKIPVVKYFLREMDAIKVNDFKKGSRNISLVKNINKKLVEELKNGKSAMIFPSGQLCSGGIERLYNKQSAFSVTSHLPDNTKVVGVRIKGLWGSMWSKAWNGKRPNFLTTYLIAIILFFANFIFFCPKRKITIEYVDITEDAKKYAQTDRKTFNKFLEDFYNKDGKEEAMFVRHLFFFPKLKNKIKTEK